MFAAAEISDIFARVGKSRNIMNDKHIQRIASAGQFKSEDVPTRFPEIEVTDDVRRRLPRFASAIDDFNRSLADWGRDLTSAVKKR